jgi:hypothetical protein
MYQVCVVVGDMIPDAVIDGVSAYWNDVPDSTYNAFPVWQYGPDYAKWDNVKKKLYEVQDCIKALKVKVKQAHLRSQDASITGSAKTDADQVFALLSFDLAQCYGDMEKYEISCHIHEPAMERERARVSDVGHLVPNADGTLQLERFEV